MRYMDGHKLYSWNKLAWLAAAGATAFLVWEVLLNHERSNMEAISEGTPLAVMIVMGVCVALSVSFYLLFRIHNRLTRAEA
jgi:hypothetical protein